MREEQATTSKVEDSAKLAELDDLKIKLSSFKHKVRQ
jgi:hypothetical protein